MPRTFKSRSIYSVLERLRAISRLYLACVLYEEEDVWRYPDAQLVTLTTTRLKRDVPRRRVTQRHVGAINIGIDSRLVPKKKKRKEKGKRKTYGDFVWVRPSLGVPPAGRSFIKPTIIRANSLVNVDKWEANSIYQLAASNKFDY